MQKFCKNSNIPLTRLMQSNPTHIIQVVLKSLRAKMALIEGSIFLITSATHLATIKVDINAPARCSLSGRIYSVNILSKTLIVEYLFAMLFYVT